MKKLLSLCLLTLIFTIGATAQDKSADLKKLLTVMKSEKLIDEMVNNMIPILKQQASSKIQGEDAQVKFEKYMDYLMQEVKDLSNKIVNEEMISIYDKHFTHQEIKDLIKFYESPTGQKLLEKTPQISADMMTAMQTKYLPEFQTNLVKKLEELK